jgi:SNF2 family DNA or RNA helicase
VTYEPLDWTQEAIQERLRDVCLSLDAADYFPIDSPIEVPVPVELPEGARKVYDHLQRDMYVALDDGTEVDAVNAAALTVKCLQVASGALYREDATWEELHDVKIEALRSIIEESAGAPVLVAYHWKADLERLLKAFPKGRALDKNPRTIKDWNAGKIPVLFAHPASAGHGLNLQDGGHILVFFSHWWDLEQYQQIIERIGPTRQAQAGHPRPVFLYHIIAKDTVDELVITRMKSKRTVQEVLLEALKNNCKAKEEGV